MPIPPAFEIAATSSGVDIHDIPGKTSGYLHPNILVILVLTEAMFVLLREMAKWF
jgi:hypothetical protein